MPPKEYPLEVESLNEFEGCHMGYFSRGHHDPDAFVRYVKDEFDEEIELGRYPHRWFRMAMTVGPDGPMHYYHEYMSAGRGRFPVTVYYYYERE